MEYVKGCVEAPSIAEVFAKANKHPSARMVGLTYAIGKFIISLEWTIPDGPVESQTEAEVAPFGKRKAVSKAQANK